jgi:hypothetical protein
VLLPPGGFVAAVVLLSAFGVAGGLPLVAMSGVVCGFCVLLIALLDWPVADWDALRSLALVLAVAAAGEVVSELELGELIAPAVPPVIPGDEEDSALHVLAISVTFETVKLLLLELDVPPLLLAVAELVDAMLPVSCTWCPEYFCS